MKSNVCPEDDVQTFCPSEADKLNWSRRRTFHVLNSLSLVRLTKSSTFSLVLRFTFMGSGKRQFVPRDEVFRLLVVSCSLYALKNREEKCDVRLPRWQNFWISTVFLDRDSYLNCWTMEEKYGLPFRSWVQWCTAKSYMSIFSFFPCHICHGLLKVCYHGNVM